LKNIIALLPMKGHSERVPNKNIKDFCGKPLFFHIGDTLKETNLFSNLIINTDSSEIADIAAKRYGDWVIIHSRPENICGDLIEMNTIIADDISQSEGEHYFQTHSTNPLLSNATIESAVGTYIEKMDTGFDSLYSVNSLQVRLFDKEFRPLNHKKGELSRTQDLDPIYEENSNFYLFSKSSFLSAKNNRIGKNPAIFKMNKLEAIDIDNEEDFLIAEAVYEKVNKK